MKQMFEATWQSYEERIVIKMNDDKNDYDDATVMSISGKTGSIFTESHWPRMIINCQYGTCE